MVMYRPVVPGCAGCAMAHPDFGRSVNPISTRGDRLCPPNYYWHTRIFRPSDGPADLPTALLWGILSCCGRHFIQIGPQRTVGESIHRMVVQDNPYLDNLYKVHYMEILEC